MSAASRARSRLFPGWLAILALFVAALAGGAQADPGAARSGLSPMPGDAEVPLSWMPPGTRSSPVPSDEIFPPQTLTIRFNHRKHVKELKLACKSCHGAALTSDAAADRLLPSPTEGCDGCHGSDHRDLGHVRAGRDPLGQCAYCHLGASAGVEGRVARMVLPRANLRFSHARHAVRNIGCGQCHGQVGELELATREQLPRMAGCLACHGLTGPAQGKARGGCPTCHLTQADGRLQTSFATGALLPPPWLRGAAHDADWIERHKSAAGEDSAFCASCHREKDCTDCHDGRVRPRTVHPNDWISIHPQAARQDNPRCASCHQEQTFCADCHRRTGVARDAPSGNRQGGRRFHLPPEQWTNAPRGPQHHAWEAMRNLNACVSCHSERDCVACHATKGVAGGGGVSPHPVGFRDRCSLALRRNPRPCLVCHAAGDRSLGMCR
jgi:hypothetical protein